MPTKKKRSSNQKLLDEFVRFLCAGEGGKRQLDGGNAREVAKVIDRKLRGSFYAYLRLCRLFGLF